MASGYIRERSPGHFRVEVYAGRDPITKKKRWLTRTVRGTKTEAERVRNKLLVEVGRADDHAGDATLADLMTLWLDVAALEESNVGMARGRKANHVDVDPVAAIKLWKLRVSDLDQFVARLRRKGLAPATARRVMGDVSSALSTAVRWGWIAHSPARAAAPIAMDQVDPPAPATAEVKALLAAAVAKEPELAVFIAVDAVLGARRGEMCALRWNAVDLAAGWVGIRRAIAHGHGSVYEKATKTRRDRDVEIGPASVEILKAHRIAMVERALACGASLAPDAYVFSDADDCSRPWRPDTTSKRFARLRDSIDLDHVQLKQLRNYVANELGDAGVIVNKVSAQLGHSRTSTTQDRYQRRFRRVSGVAEIMEGLLHGPSDAKARADADSGGIT